MDYKIQYTFCIAVIVIIAVVAAAALFEQFNSEKEIVSETEETVSETTTENPYYLVRSWEGSELLDSIFYCGENHPLPLSLEQNPDFILSDGNLIFPDGSFAAADTDENGNVISLRFKAESAPLDFSVYGIDLSAKPFDIYEKVGIANSVYGDEETVITFSFYGGGITELTFIFNEKKLSEVYIAS
ncbi:MAG: hypothetical protein ACI4KG_05510 [Oscillospiraceae bacterium]